MLAEMNWLSLTLWTPIIGGVLLMLIGDQQPLAARRTALFFATLTFLLSLPLLLLFDASTAQMQFIERVPWFPTFNSDYFLGVDGFSMPLIVLTSLMTIIVVVAGWEVIQKQVALYMAAFLLMEGMMIGVFAALDALLFYIFWEGMLIPMFLIIGIWGGPRRVYATLKFFIYTFLGSVLMLVALLYLHFQTGSFSILDFHAVKLDLTAQVLIFLAFLTAFAVKVPMWPVHTWLPDAHVEAPTGGSVILAAIMLKIGGYGFLRFSLPITPDASQELAGLMVALSLIAIVYISFVALVQEDMKKLIAYSSIAHMGFVTLGFFSLYLALASGTVTDLKSLAMGVEGGMIQMVSHGFISAALFLCVGVLYDRVHSRKISDYGGVINTMPLFAAFVVLFALANSGLPGTSGFVGEFMVILAAFKAGFWIAVLAATTLMLGAAYNLWVVKRLVFGPVVHDHVAKLEDLNPRELAILAMLAAFVIGLGVWPEPLAHLMHASVEQLLQQAATSKLGTVALVEWRP